VVDADADEQQQQDRGACEPSRIRAPLEIAADNDSTIKMKAIVRAAAAKEVQPHHPGVVGAGLGRAEMIDPGARRLESGFCVMERASAEDEGDDPQQDRQNAGADEAADREAVARFGVEALSASQIAWRRPPSRWSSSAKCSRTGPVAQEGAEHGGSDIEGGASLAAASR